MTSNTQQDQTTTTADVETRAREVIATSLIGRRVPVNKHGRVDDIGIGGQVGRQFSYLALTALTAANLRIVDATEDDRRSEALAAHRALTAAEYELSDFKRDIAAAYGRRGASSSVPWEAINAQGERLSKAVRDAYEAALPYLHDDNTGGEG